MGSPFVEVKVNSAPVGPPPRARLWAHLPNGVNVELLCTSADVDLLMGYCHVGGVLAESATMASMKRTDSRQNAPANDAISFSGYRFPPDVISYAVWLITVFH